MLAVDASVAPDWPVVFREIRDEITVIRCDFCDHNGAGDIGGFHIAVFFTKKSVPQICWNKEGIFLLLLREVYLDIRHYIHKSDPNDLILCAVYSILILIVIWIKVVRLWIKYKYPSAR